MCLLMIKETFYQNSIMPTTSKINVFKLFIQFLLSKMGWNKSPFPAWLPWQQKYFFENDKFTSFATPMDKNLLRIVLCRFLK